VIRRASTVFTIWSDGVFGAPRLYRLRAALLAAGPTRLSHRPRGLLFAVTICIMPGCHRAFRKRRSRHASFVLEAGHPHSRPPRSLGEVVNDVGPLDHCSADPQAAITTALRAVRSRIGAASAAKRGPISHAMRCTFASEGCRALGFPTGAAVNEHQPRSSPAELVESRAVAYGPYWPKPDTEVGIPASERAAVIVEPHLLPSCRTKFFEHDSRSGTERSDNLLRAARGDRAQAFVPRL